MEVGPTSAWLTMHNTSSRTSPWRQAMVAHTSQPSLKLTCDALFRPGQHGSEAHKCASVHTDMPCALLNVGNAVGCNPAYSRDTVFAAQSKVAIVWRLAAVIKEGHGARCFHQLKLVMIMLCLIRQSREEQRQCSFVLVRPLQAGSRSMRSLSIRAFRIVHSLKAITILYTELGVRLIPADTAAN
jgi:hypothetical protein